MQREEKVYTLHVNAEQQRVPEQSIIKAWIVYHAWLLEYFKDFPYGVLGYKLVLYQLSYFGAPPGNDWLGSLKLE